MSDTRVPPTIGPFNNYIRSTDTFLQSEDPDNVGHDQWERLGLTSEQATEWHDKRTAWDILYAKYSDPAQRTKPINHEVKASMEDFKTFAAVPLTTIANSPNATEEDETRFNLVRTGHRAEPTHSHTPIADNCYALLKNMGGAMIRFVFTTNHDGTRASLPEGADSLLVAVIILDASATPPTTDEGMETYVITVSESTREMGLANIGKRLYGFARYNNVKRPDLAGPWSERFSILIA